MGQSYGVTIFLSISGLEQVLGREVVPRIRAVSHPPSQQNRFFDLRGVKAAVLPVRQVRRCFRIRAIRYFRPRYCSQLHNLMHGI